MIAIKNMEMPNNCVECAFEHFNQCQLAGRVRTRVDVDRVESLDRPDWCPLVEVSEPPMLEVEHERRTGVTTIKVATRALFEALSDYADKQRKQAELLKEAMREAMPKVGYAKTHTNPEDSYREGFEK